MGTYASWSPEFDPAVEATTFTMKFALVLKQAIGGRVLSRHVVAHSNRSRGASGFDSLASVRHCLAFVSELVAVAC